VVLLLVALSRRDGRRGNAGAFPFSRFGAAKEKSRGNATRPENARFGLRLAKSARVFGSWIMGGPRERPERQ
ncbi:MAG: hypothetical protein L0Z50_02400, partial [Verrucomicrobiales bacterium]|nr:hypothetical protein [Verrucomicrobiales bacterium]